MRCSPHGGSHARRVDTAHGHVAALHSPHVAGSARANVDKIPAHWRFGSPFHMLGQSFESFRLCAAVQKPSASQPRHGGADSAQNHQIPSPCTALPSRQRVARGLRRVPPTGSTRCLRQDGVTTSRRYVAKMRPVEWIRPASGGMCVWRRNSGRARPRAWRRHSVTCRWWRRPSSARASPRPRVPRGTS